jgi:hypothetical protein
MTARKLVVPTMAGLLWALLLLGGTFGPRASSFASADGDLALHILLGDLVRESGGVLPTEPTTYTADDRPFVAHEWLSEVVLSAAHDALGLAGPVLLVALVAATTFWLLMRRMRETGVSPWPQVAIVFLALLVVNLHLNVRPHVFSWLIALIWWIRLERLRAGEISGRRWLAISGPLMVLWTNLHGAFLLGFVLMGICALASGLEAAVASGPERGRALAELRRLVGLGTVVFLLSGLNPFGFRLHLHILEFMRESAMLRQVVEFRSPDFHDPRQHLFLAVALLVFVLLIVGRRRPASVDWLLAVVLFDRALLSVRDAAFFAILTAPLAGRRLEGMLREAASASSLAGRFARAVLASSDRLLASDRRSGGGLTLAAVALGAVALLAVRGPGALSFDPARMPVGAADFVEAHPQLFEGRMYNAYAWGGYLAYRLYPQHKTFINGFNDHYGPALLEDYQQVQGLGADWREVLDRYRVAWAVVGRDSPLTRALEQAGWEPVYRDDLAELLVRPAPGAERRS